MDDQFNAQASPTRSQDARTSRSIIRALKSVQQRWGNNYMAQLEQHRVYLPALPGKTFAQTLRGIAREFSLDDFVTVIQPILKGPPRNPGQASENGSREASVHRKLQQHDLALAKKELRRRQETEQLEDMPGSIFDEANREFAAEKMARASSLEQSSSKRRRLGSSVSLPTSQIGVATPGFVSDRIGTKDSATLLEDWDDDLMFSDPLPAHPQYSPGSVYYERTPHDLVQVLGRKEDAHDYRGNGGNGSEDSDQETTANGLKEGSGIQEETPDDINMITDVDMITNAREEVKIGDSEGPIDSGQNNIDDGGDDETMDSGHDETMEVNQGENADDDQERTPNSADCDNISQGHEDSADGHQDDANSLEDMNDVGDEDAWTDEGEAGEYDSPLARDVGHQSSDLGSAVMNMLRHTGNSSSPAPRLVKDAFGRSQTVKQAAPCPPPVVNTPLAQRHQDEISSLGFDEHRHFLSQLKNADERIDKLFQQDLHKFGASTKTYRTHTAQLEQLKGPRDVRAGSHLPWVEYSAFVDKLREERDALAEQIRAKEAEVEISLNISNECEERMCMWGMIGDDQAALWKERKERMDKVLEENNI